MPQGAVDYCRNNRSHHVDDNGELDDVVSGSINDCSINERHKLDFSSITRCCDRSADRINASDIATKRDL